MFRKFATITLLLPALVLADQITMKNGDRFTGKIQKSDGKTITMKSDYAGVITLPMEAVISIKSDQPLNVVLKQGKTLVGTIESSGSQIQVASKEAQVADVTAIRDADEQKAWEKLQHPGLFDLWAGAANLSFAGTAGNSQTQALTVGVNTARVTTTDKTSVYFAAVKASATIKGVSSDTAQAVRGGWAYNHNLSSRLYLTGFNDWEYDKFQDLNLRFALG